MKIRCGVLTLAVLAASGIARADMIVTGTAGSTGCSSSSSSTSLSLYCADPASPGSYTSLIANLGDTSGNAQIFEATEQLGQISTSANASLLVSIDGTYMLTGGTGYGYATVTFDGTTFGPSFSCGTIELGGVSDRCYWQDLPPYGSWTLSDTFYVPYNTPLDLNMNFEFSMYQYGVGSGGGSFTYSLGDLSPAPAPEPPTFLLLGSALLFLLPAKFCRNLTKAPRA
jgi:hypothetical protein